MGDVTAQVIDLKEAGFTDDQSRDHIMKLARFNGEFSKLAAASIAAASNNNLTTALFTASNAIENNFYHTDFFRRDITFGTETIGGPMGGSPQRGNRFAQQNKGATKNGKPSSEIASNPSNSNMNALNLAGTETKIGSLPSANKRSLLPGEGRVGQFYELKRFEKPGDNLTPHHMPQAAYMERQGVSRRDGISMMVEQPNPGKGGRHRQTRTYGKSPNFDVSPRVELGRDIKDMRRIYQQDLIYTPQIRHSLKEVIEMNKRNYPELFKMEIK